MFSATGNKRLGEKNKKEKKYRGGGSLSKAVSSLGCIGDAQSSQMHLLVADMGCRLPCAPGLQGVDRTWRASKSHPKL